MKLIILAILFIFSAAHAEEKPNELLKKFYWNKQMNLWNTSFFNCSLYPEGFLCDRTDPKSVPINAVVDENLNVYNSRTMIASSYSTTCALKSGQVSCWGGYYSNVTRQTQDVLSKMRDVSWVASVGGEMYLKRSTGKFFSLTTEGTKETENPFKPMKGFSEGCFVDTSSNRLFCGNPNIKDSFGQYNHDPEKAVALVYPLEITIQQTEEDRYHNGDKNTFLCVIDDRRVKCFGTREIADNVPYDLQNPPETKWWGDQSNTGSGNSYELSNLISSENHVCVILNKKVRCWGRANSDYVTKVPTNLVNVRKLAFGVMGMCALDDEGMKCWGGKTEFKMPEDIRSSMGRVLDISANSLNACMISDSKTVCFNELYGEMNVSVNVSNERQFLYQQPKEFADNFLTQKSDSCHLSFSGTQRTCIDEKKFVLTWADRSKMPQQVVAGVAHLCVLNNGMVECYGDNSVRQLNVPEDLSNVVQIAAGGNHTCALKTDRTVVCWGYNAQPPADLSGVRQISAANLSTCALTESELRCWGQQGNQRFKSDPALTRLQNPISVRVVNTGNACVLDDEGVKCTGNREGVRAFMASIQVTCHGTICDPTYSKPVTEKNDDPYADYLNPEFSTPDLNCGLSYGSRSASLFCDGSRKEKGFTNSFRDPTWLQMNVPESFNSLVAFVIARDLKNVAARAPVLQSRILKGWLPIVSQNASDEDKAFIMRAMSPLMESTSSIKSMAQDIVNYRSAMQKLTGGKNPSKRMAFLAQKVVLQSIRSVYGKDGQARIDQIVSAIDKAEAADFKGDKAKAVIQLMNQQGDFFQGLMKNTITDFAYGTIEILKQAMAVGL